MLKKQLTIVNKLGLHARAAAKLVSCATRYASETLLAHNNTQVNAKSIMGIMLLAVTHGAVIELTVTGEDEQEALAAIEKLINDKFGEAE